MESSERKSLWNGKLVLEESSLSSGREKDGKRKGLVRLTNHDYIVEGNRWERVEDGIGDH